MMFILQMLALLIMEMKQQLYVGCFGRPVVVW
jgi:hypothetical protein